MDTSLDKVGFGLWQLPPVLTLALTQAFAAIGFISSVFINERSSDFIFNNEHGSDFDFSNDSLIRDISETNISYPKSNVENNVVINNVAYKNFLHKTYLMYSDIFIFNEVWSVDSTITSEFNLYGSSAWLSPMFQMAFVIGVMLGDLGGTLGDVYGRVLTIHLATLWCTLAQLVISLSPYLSIIVVCRLLTGISYSLINTSAYNLVMETTPIKYREKICLVVGLFYYIPAIILSILAYFIRNWRQLNMCNSVYVVGLSVSVIFLSKSPHCLLQKGCVKEATEVISSAYRCNKKNSPPKDLFVCKKSEAISNDVATKKDGQLKRLTESLLSLFKTRNMCIITIVHPTIFTFIGFIYYGIPLNANNFTDNPYVYLIIIESMEILPALLGSLIINKLGNINTFTTLSLIAGVCIILTMVIDFWILKWISIVVAKMCIGLLFLICWMLSSQLFPTSHRSTGAGISNFACHLGSLVASYMFNSLAKQFPIAPNLVSTVLCFLSASLIQILPETCGEPLCESISDVEKIKIKPYSCCHNQSEA